MRGSAAEGSAGRQLDARGNPGGQRDGRQCAIGLARGGDDGHLAASDLFGLRAVKTVEPEFVGQAAGALLADQQVNLHLVFEVQRRPVIAFSITGNCEIQRRPTGTAPDITPTI